MAGAGHAQASEVGTGPEGPGDLLPEHVTAVFREFLGRDASPQDVAVWMGVGSLRRLIDGVLASDEYASCLSRRASEDTAGGGLFVNCWSEQLASFCRPPGTLSADGVAIVGERGHLFLYGGSNDNLAMYRGEIAMAPDWLAGWQELVRHRVEQAHSAGRPICCLVVPDKLAVYSDLFPQPLDTGGPRPVKRLLGEAALPLVYPCEELRAARAQGETYLVTDSHLTNSGNRLLARATIEEFGISPELLDGISWEMAAHLTSGDLGRHFTPPIAEIQHHFLAPSAASIVRDNWPEVSAAGGHIGTLRVFRRDDAPDDRTVVVYGDSYGFGDEAYPGLSWFLAQVFREVHFVWVPFGWDPDYLDAVDAQLVVCQTAERFIARLPRERVDVRALVEGVGRGGALGLEQVFGDQAGR